MYVRVIGTVSDTNACGGGSGKVNKEEAVDIGLTRISVENVNSTDSYSLISKSVTNSGFLSPSLVESGLVSLLALVDLLGVDTGFE